LGYPRNFWVANPDVSNLNVGMNSDNQPLNHQVILQVRRRLSAGLAVQAGYTWSRYFSGLQGISSNVRNFGDLHTSRINLRSTGVPHAIQTLWTYDIPFGRGKRWGANTNAWIDGIAGGWTFSGTARFQTQSFVLRGVELSDGYTLKQAQKDLSVLRFVTDPITGAQTVWNFPEEIYTNTIKAFNTDETQAANGYYAPGTEPTGHYFKPAGGVMADGSLCSYLYRATAATRICGSWVAGSGNGLRARQAVPTAGPGAVRDARRGLQRDEGLELPEHDQPQQQHERVPYHVHAERSPDGSARVARELVG
jgi:hypothetical protein